MVTDNTNQADDKTAFLRAARSGNLEKVVEYLDTDLDINAANSNGLNALHLASKDGHVEIVTELLKRGAKIDAATKKGNTALHIASLAGQSEIVNILLRYGSTVNIQSQNGFTPLYMAAQENHDQVVKILLCNGANQSLATEDGFTPLAVAMQQGHDKVVSVLLENDSKGKVRLPALHIAAKKDDCKAADLLLQNDHKPDVTSKSGFTPLHIAAHYGNEEIARLLIKRGADVNYLAKHNISPLHVAAKWGKNNMVKILLENSASIDAKTRDGLTPLHCAARSGHDEVVGTLLENSAPISARTKNGLAPLHMASQGDHVDAARVLLYHRAPVDEVTIDYLTSLHVAAHCGHVRVAKLLLERKADANARALNGFTPLHIACKKNRIKVVELLIKHGASIESTTESGLTPLHVASFMGCMNIVIFLLQHEANPDVPTVRGETPLHLAARANQTDIIRILLRNGAKVDARAREQQTPLHIASRLGNVDIVMLLLQHGATVDTTTKDMYTALHIAAKEGQEEVAAILVENNASTKAATKNGFTPLHIAAKYGNINVAKILLQKDSAVDAQGKNEITALHMACHYDHPSVATLLLDKGASPHVASQNGHTPLHTAARKNQMDIASTLLEHGADANVESKAGFTPLHLSAQKGHYDMTNLLIEHGANPNHKAKNGLTALHLCAQEDFIRVASILVKNGADVESQTETGYRPIHVASHFGNLSMIRFLLKHNAEIDVKNQHNYTPLHQAAQQGHAHVASALLDGNASHKARTSDGLTALNIAQKLGYISVMEVLKGLSYDNLAPNNKNWEDKYKVVAPESLQEANFMSDSDDEGGSDTLINEQPYRYLTADLMKSLRDDSLPIDVTRDDPIHKQMSKEDRQEFVQSSNYCSAENFEMQDSLTLGRMHLRSFLVSFLVDARGGAMKGCRHSGIRIIVPPRRATMPIRVTCRLVKPSKIINPPPLMEGEALATRIIEMGPVAATFLGPVLIDVPHFASARGKEREMIILRSENGENWKEHDNSVDNDDTLANTPQDPQMSAAYSGRITRIITTDFPQYFAIITRIKQEVHVIGADGGILMSSVVNHVQAVFPPGALTKKIKVGLQAHVIPAELTAKLLGNCVAVSPVITIEPRRRKFHKPITLTIPVPQAANKGMINQYGGETPTLRLLCSIAGGTSEAQWEDVTGSTPLTFLNDERVSFTTTVSARFWLMDCRNIGEVPKMATELYKESLFVPFITNFVIYSKRMDLLEATLRILCMTEGKEGLHTLERQEEFLEIVKSRDVEALDGKDLYIEFSGNLVPVTKSGVQLKFTFKAYRQNRLSFHVKVKDPLLDPVARMLFMREPKVPKGEAPQQPICILNIVLPEIMQTLRSMENRSDFQDSNIITQKMEIFMSKREEAEGTEKSDDPKVVTSPTEDFEKTSELEDREDAAIIHESFAQKAACPVESVDASYPNKLDARDDSPSPVAEKQTYSEKRKFWEDITKKRDNLERSESEVSRTSQLTINESDSECAQTVPSEEDTEATSGRSDTMEDMNIPDISECSVAEKAHYFEEQIQREMASIGKPSAVEEVTKEAAALKPGRSIDLDKKGEESRQNLPKDVEKTIQLSTEGPSLAETTSSLKQIPEVQKNQEPEVSAKRSSVIEKIEELESKAGLSTERSAAIERKRELKSRETLSAKKSDVAEEIGEIEKVEGGKSKILDVSIMEVCRGMIDEERRQACYGPPSKADEALVLDERAEAESRTNLDKNILSSAPATVKGQLLKESQIPVKVETRVDVKPKIAASAKSQVKEDVKAKAEEISVVTAEEKVKRIRKEFESRIGSETNVEKTIVEIKSIPGEKEEKSDKQRREAKIEKVEEKETKVEEVGAELKTVDSARRDTSECREFLEQEDSSASEPPIKIQSESVKAMKMEFESRIPKHTITLKNEKEAKSKMELELKQKADVEEKERMKKELELKQKAELEERERVKKELELKQKAELEEKERVKKELELKQKAELEEKERVKKELELKQKAELKEKERVKKELELKQKAELEEKERVKKELELKQKAELEEKERVKKELELKQKAELEEKERVKKELELKQKAELKEKERVKKELELKQKAELEEKERVKKELELKQKAELEEKERVKKELELKQKAELEEKERVKKELELKQKAELEEKERVKKELELKQKAELEEKERVKKELELKQKAELEEKERVKKELELKQKAEVEEKERVKKELELKQKAELEEKERVQKELELKQKAEVEEKERVRKELELKQKAELEEKERVKKELELKQKAELEEKERVKKELELKQKAEVEEKERVKKELELKQKAELEEKERVKKELELKQKAELEEKERVKKELELKQKAELEEKERVKKELELKQKAELEEKERVKKELELKQKAELEEKERVQKELELKQKAEVEEKERVRKELELKQKAELEEKERVKKELELKQQAEVEEKERVKKELELKQTFEEKEKLKTEIVVESSVKIASEELSEKERHLKLKETMPSKIPVTNEQKTHAAASSSAKEDLKSPETVEKRKETESRIPKRITESVKTKTEITRHEDDFKAHSELLEKLKGNLTGVESEKKSAFDTSSGRNFHAVKQSFASSETTRTEKTSTEGFTGKFSHNEASEGFKLYEKMTGHGEQDATTTTTTKSSIDHKVSSRKEAREIVSSETTTKDGTKIELSEREHSEEKDVERKESKMTQILPTQKIEESKSKMKDLELISDNLTSLKMQDEQAEIAASASRSKLEKRGEQVFKLQEDEHGVSTDESSFEMVKGIDASASLEMRADLSELMGRHEPFSGAKERFDVGGGSQEKFAAKDDDESGKGSGDFDNARDDLAKKFEARNIAETIIQSIEAEIETRSMTSDRYGRGTMTPVKEETKKENRKHVDSTKSLEAVGLEEVGVDFDEGKQLLLGTKRESLQESISISEDLTKDEESSGNASFAQDSSGLKTNERDIMVSPSTISDQTEMEDSMEVETSMADEGKAGVVGDRRESRSFADQRSSVDLDPDVRLEARILEISEPVNLHARQGSLDTESIDQSSWAGSSLKRQDVTLSLENAPLDPFGRSYPERDITISPSTVSEQTDMEDSLIHDPTRKYYDMVITRNEDSFEMESPPLVSSKTSIKSLEIKPVNWMIGDEKIEISESVQPSQAFSQELDEYESIVKQESLEGTKPDFESGDEVTASVRITISSEVAASESRGKNVISETHKASKFTVIPVSDKQLESELVENNLDISCEELMETLQKEFDSKTPTENFVFGTAQSVVQSSEEVRDPVHDATLGEASKPEEPSTELSKISPKDGESTTESKHHAAEEKTKVVESKTEVEKIEDDFRFEGSDEGAVMKTISSKVDGLEDAERIDEASSVTKEEDVGGHQSSMPYDITVLNQAVSKEIAEVKESLEAAKQDLIEELNEHSEAIIQIKDSPSEFQFKLQSDSIPNDLPLLYKSEPSGVTSSPIAKPRKVQEDPTVVIPAADHDALDSSVVASVVKTIDETVDETEARPIFEKCHVPRRVAEAELKEGSPTDFSAPVPASRSSSDPENKDEASSMIPPQPAPRRRHKPARTPKKAKHETDPDVNSSSGESNYQSCDYEIGSGSRPSSSDFEAMLVGMPSGTASEYDTALTSADHSSLSRPTSQDYHTAISSLSSRESMKSLNSESSGHLASIESSSEISETLVASEADIDGDHLDDGTDYALDDEFHTSILATSRSFETAKTTATDEDAIGGLQASETTPCRMKRSSEMIFQQLDELGTEDAAKPSPDDRLDLKLKTSSDNATSTLHAGDSPGTVQSVDLITSRVETDGIQSVCTQVTSREDPPLVEDSSKTEDRTKLDGAGEELPEPESVEPKIKSLSGNESSDLGARYDDSMLVQQTSMSTSSTSGMSIETVIDKEKQDRKSPDSDSFELVDKPDIIDDFVVIEEVGREAEEFDTEGKSIHITGMAGTSKKLYDREVENLIAEKKGDAQVSSSQASRHNELFDFESEESPPQLSNEDQYSQSYSDEEQYEGSKKWVEMQFQPDTRGYELDYDRGPLEDIKEEEITDFEPGSSRFGSLGSHKESIGSIGSMKGSLGSTPDYDVLAGRKYFTKPSEHDNLSLSSLQEFENLETAMAIENARRLQCGSQDSVNGSLPRRYLAGRSGHGDDISLSSLKDFEGLEKACTEAHMIELRAREEEDLLDHESPENRYKLENLVRSKSEMSAPASFNPSTSGSDDYEKRIREIDEIIRIAQSNVEKFDRQDDTTDDISQIEITDTEKGVTSAEPAASSDADPQMHYAEANVMETSTDSLELEDVDDKKHNPLCRSSDSLEMKTTLDIPSLSSDSLNNARDSREGHLDNVDQFNNSRRLSSDSLEIPSTENPTNIPAQHYESNSNYPERQQVDNAVPRCSAPGATPQSISMKKSSSKNGT